MYGYNETTLVKESYAVLSEQGLSISSAESLTAGLFSSELASVPGASQVLKGSVTAYTNEIKQAVLGVSNETLATNGAVSQECALEMAKGAKRLFQTDVAIAFTGVAGPDKVGDQEAGVVKLALVLPDGEERVYALSLSGGRNAVRKRAVKYGYFYLLEELKRRNGSK